MEGVLLGKCLYQRALAVTRALALVWRDDE